MNSSTTHFDLTGPPYVKTEDNALTVHHISVCSFPVQLIPLYCCFKNKLCPTLVSWGKCEQQSFLLTVSIVKEYILSYLSCKKCAGKYHRSPENLELRECAVRKGHPLIAQSSQVAHSVHIIQGSLGSSPSTEKGRFFDGGWTMHLSMHTAKWH